ncbi:MmgE/PrpD family protein [Robbsia sp. Bb-Pol-6]|uniref:MmgE/PrpD family protein n=1 Tax=Robbsia betulipollinis TaxID=2981849 RepID=A0ABT3ZIZ4_9BURK|nr:MmgE/PrpD family protein [Robbsia betulipollinis]MCY0386489.1 MmgE/PrpD family protein [Robbsia betulipollinis]
MQTGIHPIASMARWLTSVRTESIPAQVRSVAKRAFIDTVGVGVAGSALPVARSARDVALLCGSAGDATVFGPVHARRHAATAALANGVAAHALDWDDNSYAGFVHASAVVVPAALAMAQDRARSGAAMIDAYIVGVECEFALATALGTVPYDRGWWTTSLFGSVGACAAACHALRLDVVTTQAALGLALTGAGGAKAGFGTDAKPLMVGRTAQAGILTALLADAGCTGPLNAVEAANGLAGLVGDGQCDRDAFAMLGREWRLLSPGIDIKRMPVCLSSHAAVDALQHILIERPGNAPIDRIVCDVPPIVVKNLGYILPDTPQQAQFSMTFAMAATVIEGSVARAQLHASILRRPDVIAMMQRVHMVSSARWDDPALSRSAPEGAWVRVEFRDGATVERFCAMPPGAGSRPLSDRQLDEKFVECVSPVWGLPASGDLLERLRALDQCSCTRTLFTKLPGWSG